MDVQAVAGAVLVLLVIGIALARLPRLAVGLYGWTALPQAALAVTLALRGGSPLLYLDAAAILAVKGVALPAYLRRRLVRSGEDFGLATAASPALLLAGAAGVVLVGLRLGALLAPGGGPGAGLCLAAMILGFGVPAVRTELWCQLAGILAGEGALVGLVLGLGAELPPAAEWLALGEVVAMAAVLAAVLRRVVALHAVADARHLGRLRG